MISRRAPLQSKKARCGSEARSCVGPLRVAHFADVQRRTRMCSGCETATTCGRRKLQVGRIIWKRLPGLSQ